MAWEENTFQLIAIDRNEPSTLHGCGVIRWVIPWRTAFLHPRQSHWWEDSGQKTPGKMTRMWQECSKGLNPAGDPSHPQHPQVKDDLKPQWVPILGGKLWEVVKVLAPELHFWTSALSLWHIVIPGKCGYSWKGGKSDISLADLGGVCLFFVSLVNHLRRSFSETQVSKSTQRPFGKWPPCCAGPAYLYSSWPCHWKVNHTGAYTASSQAALFIDSFVKTRS